MDGTLTQAIAESEESKWPGVEPAQMFVIPSYQFMLSRLEAVDSRLHTIVAFVATVTLAVPTVSRALNANVSFDSGWFIAAVVVAMVAVIIGFFLRVHGTLILPNPSHYHDKWLRLATSDFQRMALYFAGQHFDSNRELINKKAKGVTALNYMFLLELWLLFVWVIQT